MNLILLCPLCEKEIILKKMEKTIEIRGSGDFNCLCRKPRQYMIDDDENSIRKFMAPLNVELQNRKEILRKKQIQDIEHKLETCDQVRNEVYRLGFIGNLKTSDQFGTIDDYFVYLVGFYEDYRKKSKIVDEIINLMNHLNYKNNEYPVTKKKVDRFSKGELMKLDETTIQEIRRYLNKTIEIKRYILRQEDHLNNSSSDNYLKNMMNQYNIDNLTEFTSDVISKKILEFETDVKEHYNNIKDFEFTLESIKNLDTWQTFECLIGNLLRKDNLTLEDILSSKDFKVKDSVDPDIIKNILRDLEIKGKIHQRDGVYYENGNLFDYVRQLAEKVAAIKRREEEETEHDAWKKRFDDSKF